MGDDEARPGSAGREPAAPPELLVTDGEPALGRFAGPPGRANLLDTERVFGLKAPRWLKRWRLKEWQALQLGDARFFIFTALYDARSFSLALFSVWDRHERRAYDFRRLLPLRSFRLGESFDGRDLAFERRGVSLRFKNELDAGRLGVSFELSAQHAAVPVKAELSLGYGPKVAAPSAVCLPLGLGRTMYSTKALLPLEGTLELGDERFELKGPEAMGIVDDHKGYYPYRLRYDWVTGFGLDAKGRRIGFNLTDNQVRDQERYNENALWVNAKLYPLPPVKITRPYGYEGEWHIQDVEGLVDLIFKPERQNDLVVKALAIRSDYHGPYGRFEGALRSPEGNEKIDAKILYGMGEQKYLRA